MEARTARRFLHFEVGLNFHSGSNSKDSFILDTNASDFAIGAELIQVQEDEERAIAFGSLSLTLERQRYCTTGKEL